MLSRNQDLTGSKMEKNIRSFFGTNKAGFSIGVQ
jgi:hypothetical protein